jgi:hypothetical protein
VWGASCALGMGEVQTMRDTNGACEGHNHVLKDLLLPAKMRRITNIYISLTYHFPIVWSYSRRQQSESRDIVTHRRRADGSPSQASYNSSRQEMARSRSYGDIVRYGTPIRRRNGEFSVSLLEMVTENVIRPRTV